MLRRHPEHDLKIRVDDEVAVYQFGEVVLDTFAQWFSQWDVLNDVKLTDDVLVIKAYNGV